MTCKNDAVIRSYYRETYFFPMHRIVRLLSARCTLKEAFTSIKQGYEQNIQDVRKLFFNVLKDLLFVKNKAIVCQT